MSSQIPCGGPRTGHTGLRAIIFVAPLIYALHEALIVVEEEGLDARWERHRLNHLALVDALADVLLGRATGGAEGHDQHRGDDPFVLRHLLPPCECVSQPP